MKARALSVFQKAKRSDREKKEKRRLPSFLSALSLSPPPLVVSFSRHASKHHHVLDRGRRRRPRRGARKLSSSFFIVDVRSSFLFALCRRRRSPLCQAPRRGRLRAEPRRGRHWCFLGARKVEKGTKVLTPSSFVDGTDALFFLSLSRSLARLPSFLLSVERASESKGTTCLSPLSVPKTSKKARKAPLRASHRVHLKTFFFFFFDWRAEKKNLDQNSTKKTQQKTTSTIGGRLGTRRARRDLGPRRARLPRALRETEGTEVCVDFEVGERERENNFSSSFSEQEARDRSSSPFHFSLTLFPFLLPFLLHTHKKKPKPKKPESRSSTSSSSRCAPSPRPRRGKKPSTPSGEYEAEKKKLLPSFLCLRRCRPSSSSRPLPLSRLRGPTAGELRQRLVASSSPAAAAATEMPWRREYV